MDCKMNNLAWIDRTEFQKMLVGQKATVAINICFNENGMKEKM